MKDRIINEGTDFLTTEEREIMLNKGHLPITWGKIKYSHKQIKYN